MAAPVPAPPAEMALAAPRPMAASSLTVAKKWSRTCAPTSPKRSTSIPKSSPTRTARHHLHSAGGLHHHLAHGHAGLHYPRRAGQRNIQHESLPGFLRRSGSAGHAHARRPRVDSRGRLQLLRRRAATSSSGAAKGAIGSPCVTTTSPPRPSPWIRPRGRVAVHARSAAHRQIQADPGRAYERRKLGAPRISWCAKSKWCPTAASRTWSSTGAWKATPCSTK
jgi:hypothetical protein